MKFCATRSSDAIQLLATRNAAEHARPAGVRFAQARIRLVFELVGSGIMLAVVLAVALFA